MKRFLWVDYAKAIGIFLVLLGHCHIDEQLRTWIYSFHMPLFFFISGFLIKSDFAKIDIQLFFKKHLLKSFKFYFLFGLLSIPLFFVFNSDLAAGESTAKTIGNRLYSVIYASGTNETHLRLFPLVLWYFPTLITGLSFLYFLLKYLGKFTILLLPATILLSLATKDLVLPWEMESAIPATTFLYCGLLFRNHLYPLLSSPKVPIIASIIPIAVASYLAFWNGKVNMRTSEFEQPILYYATALLFLTAFPVLFRDLPASKEISAISLNTVYIFPLHAFTFKVYNNIVYGILDLEISFLLELAKAVLSLIGITIVFQIGLSRYQDWAQKGKLEAGAQ